MKNKEFLIKILLMLRSKGINNEKILFSVEKIPPHYYLYLLRDHGSLQDINFDEIVRLTRILQDAINYKNRLGNVLISGFKQGWFLSISSFLAKRIYSYSLDKTKITKAENIYNILGLNNIFLKKSSSFLDWKQVAPFDLIVIFKNYNSVPHQYLELLSKDGVLFFTKENKNKVCIIKCSKEKEIEKIKASDFNLEENIIL